MTSKRAAAYVGGGALLVAYLAAANNSPVQDAEPATSRAPHVAAPAPDALAREVAAQAATLRSRLAVAPVPELHPRNPFTFAPAAAARRTAPGIARAAISEAPEPAAPAAVLMPLSLMGIAEDPSPAGPHRTAIIGGPGDALYIVAEGQAVGDRYRVTAIGADAVELRDLLTGGVRRLAMR